MKKIIFLILGLSYSIFSYANLATSDDWGKVYFYDTHPNDMRLLLTATCADSSYCPGWMGIGTNQSVYYGYIHITSAKIQDLKWDTLDISSSIPKKCLTITAPQNITFSVDPAGNVKVTC